MDDDTAEISGDENEAVQQTFKTSHLLVKILETVIEQQRKKLYTVGTRTRQGDLRGFLELRLVNEQFNQAVCATLRIEFRRIEVDVDDHFIRCNEFTIARHQKPANQAQRNPEENPNERNDIEDDLDEEMPAPEDLPSEDSLDAIFLQRFFRWLADTFDPIVENFKIYDSWTFKPCSLPPSWTNRLTVFNSMHPDMEYCNCNQCIQTVRSCRTLFGPLSFQMAQDALCDQQLSYGAMYCTDAFLADIALQYTITVGENKTFDRESFIRQFGGIRCDNIIFAVQTLASYRDEHPKPQPLEVIQLLLKLWEVQSAEFEVVKFMENDYYVQRCAWEETNVFHKAFFATYNFDRFDDQVHVTPYQEAGKLDRELQHEFTPIFDLRIDPCDGPFRMGSNLSLLSIASQSNSNGSFSWLHQGRIAFNMFSASRVLFISSGVIDFRGIVGTANWLKFTMRDMMRNIWGPRDKPVLETGKTVFWVQFMEDVSDCFLKVWNEHARELLNANFPNLVLRMNTSEAFDECSNHRIATYSNTKRPDVQKQPLHKFYCTFYNPVRNNTTHIKLVQVEN
uniref:C2 domain-containing protein n=1 Tax=Caenorhabditis tropicalis TaxID=1561998 RepID=A0A1I7UL13_9PELO